MYPVQNRQLCQYFLYVESGVHQWDLHLIDILY